MEKSSFKKKSFLNIKFYVLFYVENKVYCALLRKKCHLSLLKFDRLGVNMLRMILALCVHEATTLKKP